MLLAKLGILLMILGAAGCFVNGIMSVPPDKFKYHIYSTLLAGVGLTLFLVGIMFFI